MEYYRAYMMAWRKTHRTQKLAHRAVEKALKTGALLKAPCRECGSKIGVHAHHDNYSQPLEVAWLCRRHHMEHHRKNKMSIEEMIPLAYPGGVPKALRMKIKYLGLEAKAKLAPIYPLR